MKKLMLIAIAATGLFLPKLNAQVLRDSLGYYELNENVRGRAPLDFKDYEKYRKERIALLEQEKAQIVEDEKEALKKIIESIDARLERKEITPEKALALKEKAAKIAAENIDNKTEIINNHIALVNRDVYYNLDLYTTSYVQIGFGNATDEAGSFLLGLQYKGERKKPKYDKRTFADIVVAAGFGSMHGDPYKFFKHGNAEFGLTLRTRLFKDHNKVRLLYGVSYMAESFQFNDNKYVVNNNGYSTLETFSSPLKKRSYFQVNKIIAPFYLEFGPSKKKEYKDYFRYDTSKAFKIGIGGYVGAAVSAMQVLKYNENGHNVVLKRRADYNTNGFVYGVNGYIGLGDISLFGRYEINKVFKDADIKNNALSVGLRVVF